MNVQTENALGETCTNCAAAVTGEYCSVCGQRQRGRLALGWLLREVPERLLNGEQGIFRTFVDLTLRPGRVSRAYIDGQRRRYVNPLSYYLIAAAVQLLAMYFSGDAVGEAIRAGVTEERAAELRAAGVADPLTWVPERYEFLIQNAYTWLGLLTLVLPMTLVIWLFLFRTVNFAEALVFSMFTLSHVILLTGLMNPITTAISLPLHGAIALGMYFVFAIWAGAACFGRRFLVITACASAMAVAYLSFLTTLQTGFQLLTDPTLL